MALVAGCAPAVAVPTATAAPSPTVTLPATATITPSPTVSPTPDPYYPYTIDYLRTRTYGGGAIQIVEKVGQNSAFTRYLIQYPSDGLTIAGFMDVPGGQGPFPVIIALHGYINPSVYGTLDYTTHYADTLASAGYLVLHPNLRNFPPSDSGDDLFRVGMATDALNLIAIVKQTGGQPGPLEAADPTRIGMWGHSMGGGITTRVLTVSEDVRAAVLYSPMSGDEVKNYAAIAAWSNDQRGIAERSAPATALQRISPMYFYGDVQAAVSINHGLADALIPVAWSQETCAEMQAAGSTVECRYYDEQPHTFRGQGDREFIQNSINFFDNYLKQP
jgi:dipeptidyl aminopeptidase/acylaminoacyl peptidase